MYGGRREFKATEVVYVGTPPEDEGGDSTKNRAAQAVSSLDSRKKIIDGILLEECSLAAAAMPTTVGVEAVIEPPQSSSASLLSPLSIPDILLSAINRLALRDLEAHWTCAATTTSTAPPPPPHLPPMGEGISIDEKTVDYILSRNAVMGWVYHTAYHELFPVHIKSICLLLGCQDAIADARSSKSRKVAAGPKLSSSLIGQVRLAPVATAIDVISNIAAKVQSTGDVLSRWGGASLADVCGAPTPVVIVYSMFEDPYTTSATHQPPRGDEGVSPSHPYPAARVRSTRVHRLAPAFRSLLPTDDAHGDGGVGVAFKKGQQLPSTSSKDTILCVAVVDPSLLVADTRLRVGHPEGGGTCADPPATAASLPSSQRLGGAVSTVLLGGTTTSVKTAVGSGDLVPPPTAAAAAAVAGGGGGCATFGIQDHSEILFDDSDESLHEGTNEAASTTLPVACHDEKAAPAMRKRSRSSDEDNRLIHAVELPTTATSGSSSTLHARHIGFVAPTLPSPPPRPHHHKEEAAAAAVLLHHATSLFHIHRDQMFDFDAAEKIVSDKVRHDAAARRMEAELEDRRRFGVRSGGRTARPLPKAEAAEQRQMHQAVEHLAQLRQQWLVSSCVSKPTLRPHPSSVDDAAPFPRPHQQAAPPPPSSKLLQTSDTATAGNRKPAHGARATGNATSRTSDTTARNAKPASGATSKKKPTGSKNGPPAEVELIVIDDD